MRLGSRGAGADTPSRITLSAGGQAANVAAWVAALGGRARWLGKRADDDAGRLAASCRRLGVELVGPVEPEGNGIVVSLVGPDGERSMCPDRGVAADLQRKSSTGWLAGCDHLHVSGYALLARAGRRGRGARRRSHVEQARGSASTSPPGARSATRRPSGFRRARRGARAGCRVRERGRGATLGGRLPGVAWILKRGARGCSFDGEERAALPVPQVVDTTGAGDALAAGWIVGGPELALRAAAGCVQRAGSMPRLRGASRACSSGVQPAVLDLLAVSDEIAVALDEERAVVALETTLVAHGFPAPSGVEVGLASETAVRAAGAVPATIGVLDGRIHVGLPTPQLERFTPDARKLGPRDLAACAVQGAAGATTVGGTLTAAAALGIRFLGTGGLGGVHRGFPSPPDVSADLGACARSRPSSSRPA